MRDFKYYLSGGGANTDPDLSLGSSKSTTETGVQSVAWDGAVISGITLNSGGGNQSGLAGTLSFVFATGLITYTPPSFVSGTQNSEDITLDGDYVLYGEDASDPLGVGAVEITVVAASLPGADASEDIVSTSTANNLFDDITKSESSLGGVEYRCVYITNELATDETLNLWVDRQPSPDSIQIGFDPVGAGGTAPSVVDETTAPNLVSFTAPSEVAPLAVALIAGQSVPVWVRRSIPALNPISNTGDLFVLGTKVS